MRTTILVTAILLALPAAAPLASAGPACPGYDASGTQFWINSGGCVGATVGLGSDFRCVRGVGEAAAGPVWVNVLSTWGCQTGAAVTLP